MQYNERLWEVTHYMSATGYSNTDMTVASSADSKHKHLLLYVLNFINLIQVQELAPGA